MEIKNQSSLSKVLSRESPARRLDSTIVASAATVSPGQQLHHLTNAPSDCTRTTHQQRQQKARRDTGCPPPNSSYLFSQQDERTAADH